MFKKKPNVNCPVTPACHSNKIQIKPLAPIRSSDRRRTADQIITDLGLEVSATDDANTEEKAAATAERSSLRNSLLPDNSQSARFTTTHGPNLKKISGTVYVGTHLGDEQRVLWVNIEDKMFPTGGTLTSERVGYQTDSLPY